MPQEQMINEELVSFEVAKLAKEKGCPATPEECYENRDECGPSEVPPARPLDEAPDFMADGPVVNPTGPFTAEQ